MDGGGPAVDGRAAGGSQGRLKSAGSKVIMAAAASNLFASKESGKGRNFKVVIRVRPENEREQSDKSSRSCVTIDGKAAISIRKPDGADGGKWLPHKRILRVVGVSVQCPRQ